MSHCEAAGRAIDWKTSVAPSPLRARPAAVADSANCAPLKIRLCGAVDPPANADRAPTKQASAGPPSRPAATAIGSVMWRPMSAWPCMRSPGRARSMMIVRLESSMMSSQLGEASAESSRARAASTEVATR